ncbi:HNH endonuclease [Parapedobacter soli]|uniref:HNH endonuclease n=1 Tax=Parapedobacter soli TaxID=416955 RepID=UPI0021CABC89|nr:HNH endonuclease [Parapedobacter soli]
MKLTKTQREEIRMKYGGRCAYCGCELGQRWHADHLIPIRRSERNMREYNGNLVRDAWGKIKTEKYIINPEADCIDNMMPSCASCNILKNSLPLESFRSVISGFITSLNRDINQYKISKRYGLVQETGIEVKFYFETYESK